MDSWEINNSVFQQICDRIVAKECIPFLGSGISNNSQYSGKDENYKKKQGHTVKGMKSFLRKKQVFWRKKTLGELCEEYLWNNKKTKSNALESLVDRLKIREMCYLEPTIAHRCIAYLARKKRLVYYYKCKVRFEEEKLGNRLEVMHNSFAIC
ncbi:MAG TPA: hypothetical protein P5105_06725 [Victivallales bacterium]|nr:hypothetical protein [Victivallales bacterium]